MKNIYIATGVLLIVFILTLPKAFGLDDEPTDIDTDAQKAAQRQNAADKCTVRYGKNAIFFETKGGHLVCRNGAMK